MPFAHSAGDPLPREDRSLLFSLQHQALAYFIDNQLPHGLILDRQSNHGPRRAHGLCSTAATGMGFVALALASAPPYRLLSREAAAQRIRTGLRTVFERLPQDHGVIPHFTHSASFEVIGHDAFSTVETAWLAAGALWAGEFLRDSEILQLADRFYQRIDWRYWTTPELTNGCGLLRHGKRSDGAFLECTWDRLNGETVFMYVLAAGAASSQAIHSEALRLLQPCYGEAAGFRFNNADLGLFVFQYGLDLLDLCRWRSASAVDLWTEAGIATRSNFMTCRAVASRFATFERFWGLSPGDGPGGPGEDDVYRCYAPGGPIDGTAHITATLASVAHDPEAVLQNAWEAEHDIASQSRGRYGFSNVSVDRNWVSQDVVGIDLGAAVLALDNYLVDSRVRRVFQGLPCVIQGLQRLGFATDSSSSENDGDRTPPVRRAS